MAAKIIVGMSGGVDSSVAAHLLCKQGFQVEGLFMKNWEEDDDEEYCAAAVDLADALKVCEQLKIPLHTVNFSAEYWDRVFEYFIKEYQAGRTPNPDIICNKEIKFRAFLDYALDLDATYIATGHYADCIKGDSTSSLVKALDQSKDQSYFLHTLDQHQLGKSLFPLGKIPKTRVRKIAKENSFDIYDKKDSTGICFIGERKFKDFLKNYIPANPGNIVTPEGDIIGQHEGVMYYTIGQRQGLGIGGQQSFPEEPWYVIDKRLTSNELVAAQGHDNNALFHSKIITQQIHWVAGLAPTDTKNIMAKIRYRQEDQPCSIHQAADNQYEVLFDSPQWAVTPGQSVVFYNNDICLGGAIIDARMV